MISYYMILYFYYLLFIPLYYFILPNSLFYFYFRIISVILILTCFPYCFINNNFSFLLFRTSVFLPYFVSLITSVLLLISVSFMMSCVTFMLHKLSCGPVCAFCVTF